MPLQNPVVVAGQTASTPPTAKPIPLTADGSAVVTTATLSFSGSVEIGTVDQGVPAAIGNAWYVSLTDGSDVLGTVLHPLNVALPSGTVAVTQGTSPWVISGTVSWSSAQHIIVDSGSITFTNATLAVTNSNLDVALSTLAKDATLTGGSAKLQVYDGTNTIFTSTHAGYVQFGSAQHIIVDSGSITVSGTVAATQSGTWAVRAQDGAGTALTSTGSALDVNLKTSSITLNVAFATAQHVIIDSATLGTVTVTGTVTANQGGSNWSINLAQVNGHTTAEAGQNGALQVGGAVATNTVVSSATNPLLIAGSDYAGTPKIQTLKVDSSGIAFVQFSAAQHVIIDSGTVAATQSGTWNIATVTTLTSITNTVNVSATQSGTWSVRAQDGSGTALTSTGSALDVNLKTSSITLNVSAAQSGAWTARLTDGTNPITKTFDLDTGAGAEWQQGVNLRISASGGSIEAKGQQAMASSIPVVLASDQAAIPVTQSGTWNIGTVTTLTSITNTVNVSAAQSGTWSVRAQDGAGTALTSTGSALDVNLKTSSITLNVSVQNATLAVTQSTSPWVDNITQVGGSAIALGQTTKSASLPVAIASDQGTLTVQDAADITTGTNIRTKTSVRDEEVLWQIQQTNLILQDMLLMLIVLKEPYAASKVHGRMLQTSIGRQPNIG